MKTVYIIIISLIAIAAAIKIWLRFETPRLLLKIILEGKREKESLCEKCGKYVVVKYEDEEYQTRKCSSKIYNWN